MNILNAIVDFISKLLNWWFIVMPWEQSIHVRLGKKSKVKGPGFYWQIPFIDKVFVQTTRMRMIDVAMQTMSTKDGSTVTVKSCLGYSIDNIEHLYKTLYHPEVTLCSMVQGKIGEYIRENLIADISPAKIEASVNEIIKNPTFGLKDINVRITTFAIVKTYRIMQDYSGLTEGLNMEPRQTPGAR